MSEMEFPEVKSPTFACRCAPKSVTEANAVRKWAATWMGRQKGRPVAAADFVTHVVARLAGYEGTIDGLYSDQWFGVAARTNKIAAEEFSTFVACDRVEDGLAFTLLAWVRKFGDGNNRPPPDWSLLEHALPLDWSKTWRGYWKVWAHAGKTDAYFRTEAEAEAYAGPGAEIDQWETYNGGSRLVDRRVATLPTP